MPAIHLGTDVSIILRDGTATRANVWLVESLAHGLKRGPAGPTRRRHRQTDARQLLIAAQVNDLERVKLIAPQVAW
jgi:hypothetical protein